MSLDFDDTGRELRRVKLIHQGFAPLQSRTLVDVAFVGDFVPID
jgi:hypothetical protein